MARQPVQYGDPNADQYPIDPNADPYADPNAPPDNPVAGGVAAPAAPFHWNPTEAKPGDPGYPATGWSPTPVGPPQWEPGVGELGPPTPDGTGVGGSGVIPPVPPAGAASPIPANGDMGGLIAARLNDLFSQSASPSLSDPALAAERLTSQRNFENQRALLAERAGVEGTSNSGGFDSRLLGLGQERGLADLQAAGAASGTRQQQILSALQLASQNQSGNNQLGLSYAQLEALLNSQALQALMAGTGA